MEKDQFLKFRVSKDDKIHIESRAKSLGLKTSEYCRRISKDGKIIMVSKDEKLVLRGLSNNLNQLMIKYHSEGIRPGQIEQELFQILETLKNAYR